MPNIKETEAELKDFRAQGFSSVTIALSLNSALIFVDDFDYIRQILESLTLAGAFVVGVFGWKDGTVRIRAVAGWREEQGLRILLAHKEQLLKQI